MIHGGSNPWWQDEYGFDSDKIMEHTGMNQDAVDKLIEKRMDEMEKEKEMDAADAEVEEVEEEPQTTTPNYPMMLAQIASAPINMRKLVDEQKRKDDKQKRKDDRERRRRQREWRENQKRMVMEKRKEAREKALQEEEQFKRLKDLQYHHMHERSIKGNFPPSDVELGELHMLEERFKGRLAREREATMRVAREKKRAELKALEAHQARRARWKSGGT